MTPEEKDWARSVYEMLIGEREGQAPQCIYMLLKENEQLQRERDEAMALLRAAKDDMLDILASGRPTGSTDLIVERIDALIQAEQPVREGE